jgi:hypothetical protein
MPSLFIFDPDGPHSGFQAIDKAIEQLLLKFPEFVFSQLGKPDSQNGIGRLTWGFGRAGEKPAVTGLDVIISRAGKIEALYTFLDPADR